MNGAIDEVRIWNVARQASDIQDFKDRQIEVTATGLVGYWPLDEGSGTVAQDKTSHARHKSLTAVSKLANAFYFSGSSIFCCGWV